MINKTKTIFIDIDGTMLFHSGIGINQCNMDLDLLPGVKSRIQEWDRKGYNIILTTGRRNSQRRLTELQLERLNIPYDQLIMGIGGGQRVLINDYKEGSKEPTAIAICVDRNAGLENVDI